MKMTIPTPVIIAAVVVLVLIVGALFLKGVGGGETTAPKPDPARFLPKGVSPVKTP